ncbi:MAG: hypothetical protein J6Z20_05575, partial [Bacteroidales bacterium]|nr:hypothetical protein [Bacteroidales bacterium]
QATLLHPQPSYSHAKGASACHRTHCKPFLCTLNHHFRTLRGQAHATEHTAGHTPAPSTKYFGR